LHLSIGPRNTGVRHHGCWHGYFRHTP
jgi:hypothetical protein